jgi:hypothetical protein
MQIFNHDIDNHGQNEASYKPPAGEVPVRAVQAMFISYSVTARNQEVTIVTHYTYQLRT